MKIIELSNVTKSGEIRVNKSIGSLVVALESLSLNALTNEKITLYVERANGNNVYLANKLPLLDFILASTYGGSAIQSDIQFDVIAKCELSLDAGIFLDDKETLIIELEGLKPLSGYKLFGIEEAEQTNLLYFFETKTLSSDDVNKKFQMVDYDMCVISDNGDISDISLTYPNNQVIKYLPFELQVVSRDIDPIAQVRFDDYPINNFGSRIVLPMVGIQFIEFNKSQGNSLNMVVRNLKSV